MMMSVSSLDIATARAVPIARVVGAVVQLNRQGFGLCPFHDERDASFHVEPKRNRWKCFGCGMGGDPISFVQAIRQLDFVAAVKELAGHSSMPAQPVKSASDRQQPRQRVGICLPGSRDPQPYITQLWESADASRLVELYLYSRGIKLRPKPVPSALRGHKRVWCTETQTRRPAVLAAISAADGAITALQRIWVSEQFLSDGGISPPKGSRATDLAAGKKTIGPMGSGAVRLAEPREVVGLAEGIETALSAAQIFRIPVWAALGAQRLGAVTLPKIVRQVIICGDNGSAGEKAAMAAVSAYQRRGYAAEAAFPDRGADFNEMLIAAKI